MGAGSKKAEEKIDALKEQLEELKEKPDTLKEVYQDITGTELTDEELLKFANGETSLLENSEAGKAVNNYTEGQKMAVDVAGDMLSGIAAVGSIAMAPFTGGASLLLAAGTGAAVKIAVKGADCIGNEKEYGAKDVLYDLVTGSINGLMAPISNGLGGAAGTGVAKAFGLEAAENTAKAAMGQAMKQIGKEAAEEVVEQGAKQAGKSLITKILAKQGAEYVLKEGAEATIKTTVGKIAAYGVDMMVDGALSGATDGFARALAEGRIEDIPEEMISGTIGGAIASPIIGGSFRAAGKLGSSVLNKVNNKITVNKLLPDGTRTTFAQGETGDCAFLSVFDGLLGNAETSKTLKKSIVTNADGNFDVSIGGKTVTVLKSALSDEALSDKTGVRIFESAYKEAFGEIDGGFADVIAKQMGLNPVHITGDSITDEILESIQKQQDDLILSFGARLDDTGAISESGPIQHYFSIKGIDSGSKSVTLADTYDTSKTFTLSFDDIKQKGVSIDGGSIKKTDLPNMERSADDLEFYGLFKKKKYITLGKDGSASYAVPEKKKGIVQQVKDGLAFAKKAYDNADFQNVEKFVDKFSPDAEKLQHFLLTNEDYSEYAQKHGTFDLIAETFLLKETGAEDDVIVEQYKKIIESLGTGPTKYAQNISGDEVKMSKFLAKLTEAGQIDEAEIPLIKEAMRKTKTDCSFTRNVSDALSEIQSSYPDLQIKSVKPLSAASVGETYLATKEDGSQLVVKMIKQNVTHESLSEETDLFSKILRGAASDDSSGKADELVDLMCSIYEDFHKELDFNAEATANRQLKESLTRSQVAPVIAVADDGRSLVMEMAEGIQANKLIPVLQEYSQNDAFKKSINKMISEYKSNPSAFNPSKYTGSEGEYAKMLAKYPAMQNPSDVVLELPKTLTGSFSEQMMFLKNIDGKTGAIMHGDPHTGNFFVNFDSAGKPVIQYIDTGNVVNSSASQVVSNLKFFMSYFMGNTQEMSTYLVNSCASCENNLGLSKTQLIDYISNQLKTDVFKFDSNGLNAGGQRITDFGKVYSSMSTIIENLGLKMNPDIANYQKAQGMFLDAITTTNRFTGQSFDMMLLMKDLLPAVKSMKANGGHPSQLIKMALSYLAGNTEQAVGTIGQFRLNSKEKSEALAQAIARLQE